MEDLKELINKMLKGLGVTELESLDSSLNLRDDLEIDSISYAELVVIVENKFGININAEGRAETLGDVMKRLSI